MSSMEQGSDAQRQATLQKLEEMQMKDTLRMFNGLVERCLVSACCLRSFHRRGSQVVYVVDASFPAVARRFLQNVVNASVRVMEPQAWPASVP